MHAAGKTTDLAPFVGSWTPAGELRWVKAAHDNADSKTWGVAVDGFACAADLRIDVAHRFDHWNPDPDLKPRMAIPRASHVNTGTPVPKYGGLAVDGPPRASSRRARSHYSLSHAASFARTRSTSAMRAIPSPPEVAPDA